MQTVQLLVSGVSLGCIYALVSLGFVLIYKATETVNFAQGELMMVGAFGCLMLMASWHWPFWLAALITVVAMFAIGVAMERTVIRPVLGQPVFSVLVLTIGIGYVLRGLVSMIPEFGTETSALEVPYKGHVLNVAGAVISQEQVAVVVVTLLLCIALFVLFRYSRIGIAMQAVSQNQLAAYYMGIPVRKMNGLVWGIAAVLAAAAGLLLAPFTFVHANMGFVGLKAFAAAVVGGFGSLPGAVVGGILVGLIESVAGFYLPAGFKDVAAYVIVLIVLVVRPNGLFGGTLRKKV